MPFFFSVLSNSEVFENGKAVLLCICLSGISACLKLCVYYCLYYVVSYCMPSELTV
jgi:hypothetical protein